MPISKHTLDIVIPTRNRPDKLQKCLEALAIARTEIKFECYVCDSSQTEELRAAVSVVVGNFDFALYSPHSANGSSAARNYGVKISASDLIIVLDDDVYVEPNAILVLYNRYRELDNQNSVVCGRVKFGEDFSARIKMRPIGYGREAKESEATDFVVSAFLLYPRSLAERYPWNENTRTSEDRFMGAVWKMHGIDIVFEDQANATHDALLNTYDVTHQRSHIYANLFDAIFARKSLYWFLCFEVLGFLAGAKKYFRNIDEASLYLKAWFLGHKDFIRDIPYFRNLARVQRP